MNNIAKRRALARKSGDKDYESRRAALLKAAARIFLEKGFRATNLDDIARMVGINRASLYYYVSGKEELFREINRDATLENVLMAERICMESGNPRDKLRAFMVALMESFERHYPYLYVYIQEDMTRVSSDRTRWGKEMKSLAKRFDEAVTGIVLGGFDPQPTPSERRRARLLAFGIIGLCNWSHRWYRPGQGMNAQSLGNLFADMILNGVFAQPGPDKVRQVAHLTLNPAKRSATKAGVRRASQTRLAKAVG